MNKKLIAAAIVAAVVAAPAAFADSVVYGRAHVSVDMNDEESFGDKDNYEVNSRSSRLGFKGSEDLGNGLKAIYQFEFGIDVDDNAGINGGRNTFVGLAGDWGTFLVGKHDTPQKVAFYAAGNERLGDSIVDLNLRNCDFSRQGSAPIGVFHECRADNAIAYVSPSFGGFSVAGAVVPGEATDGDSADLNDAYSVGAMFSSNGLRASVGYTDYNDLPGATDVDVLQVGASMTMNAFSIGAQYETSDLDGTDYDAWAVTGKFTFGNNAVSVLYTDSDMEDTYDTSGWGLAAEHNFSKRTKVYAAYASAEQDNEGGSSTDDDVFSLGMIHDF
ncbi:MAG: porin [Chromatiaceae bacterium]|nr:porin [Chromatiaceae bacterium]MCP5314795.1 porin [Chromatiaceae bacterium]